MPWSWVALLWERMTAALPGRWALAMGASPHPVIRDADGKETIDLMKLTRTGETWAAGLAGLTAEQLGAGVRAVSRTWAEPRAPMLGEFRALCIGIPSLADVRAEMSRSGPKRSPFAIMVGRRLDYYQWRHADQREADRMLREAYLSARDAAMAGEPLPEPLPELKQEEKPAKPRTPEIARAAIDEIRAMLRPVESQESPPETFS